MRGLASKVTEAARANDGKAVVDAKDKLDKNCNDCHAVFRKDDK
jgi:cytochrome c556